MCNYFKLLSYDCCKLKYLHLDNIEMFVGMQRRPKREKQSSAGVKNDELNGKS